MKQTEDTGVPNDRKDYHTLSNPEQIAVKDVDLDLTADFNTKKLSGTATLTVDRSPAYRSGPLLLDTRDLTITKTESSIDLSSWAECRFELGKADAILGAPLKISLPDSAKFVRVHYATSPHASGLQWLTPEQTAGKKQPFLFSQSQSIHARSWVPLQDSPGVRITYSARLRVPKPLFAVMSAENDPTAPRDGEFRFRMPQPIPSYLMAIAVGDIAFRPMGKRTGVYAEPGVVQAAAREFSDTEGMLLAAESLYGPYRWGRYDILVLPPSFPFGGMENPRLTFATPTIIAGDKSLVDTIAHELAHSWSGNLVTNATWRDFWLNEGFTTYLTVRIQEKVFGEERAEMEAVLERQVLDRELKRLAPKDQVLYIDLKGRDPDEASTELPYAKGMLFLRTLEDAFGRPRFDTFLQSYFQRFAFQSITTADFVAYLKQNLFSMDPEVAKTIPLDDWLTKPGVPASAVTLTSRSLTRVADFAARWGKGEIKATDLAASKWSTQEWMYFLRALPEPLDRNRMAELDAAFSLTKAQNAEVEAQWLLMAVQSGYEPAYPALERFLTTVGRRKYIEPLYEALAKTPEGKRRAKAIYAKARPGYHPIATTTVDQILK